MLKQKLSQKLLQKLSPQQIQLMKLLQIPTASLEERIKEELEVNPALEETASNSSTEKDIFDDEPDHNSDYASTNEERGTDDYENDSSTVSEDDFFERPTASDDLDLSSYLGDDEDIGSYRLRDDYSGDPDEEERRSNLPIALNSTFHEMLMEQLSEIELSNHHFIIGSHLIGSIDEDGYLRREIDAIVDDLAFSQNVITNEQELKSLLTLIQMFDPPGVGASTLQECLLLQIRRKISLQKNKTLNKYLELADEILETFFEEFTKKHYEKLCKNMGINNEELKCAIDEILKCNPKPGGNYGNSKLETYIIPDFFISNNNGKLELTLNSKNAPDLKISDTYRDMLREYTRSKTKSRTQKEAVLFIKQKLDSAKWFIDAIKQRQQTMYSTMYSIMDYQYEYFLTGDETRLRPMILKDIAEITGLDISTVSRVSNSKYVQTEFGTFKLKSFFSESLQTESGDEVSTREVKKILSEFIDSEDKEKPLSDEKLTDMLLEKGYNIARRTVAKYREQLNIPVARLRKEL